MNKSKGLSLFGLANKFTEIFIPSKYFLLNCFHLICSPRLWMVETVLEHKN